MRVHRLVEPNVFYKAEAFHVAADILSKSDTLKYRGSPFIVNASFALELYLKSFNASTFFENPKIYREGVTHYDSVYSKSEHDGLGHDLSNLYTQIPECIKSELEVELNKHDKDIALPKFFEKYRSHFVGWRYSFEGKADPYCAPDILVVLNVLHICGQAHLS